MSTSTGRWRTSTATCTCTTSRATSGAASRPRVTSPNAPLLRSGHAWTRAANPGHVYLFGGEFSSPKQGTFHNYSDFWRLEPASREWLRIEPRARDRGPPARSGHRMTYWRHYIILFGGFQDTSNQTRYLADLWIFDTVHFTWHCPALPQAQLKPDARSSFTLLPCEQGAVLYGGYSRVKASVALKKRGAASKNVLLPKVHDDCFFLRMALPAADAGPGAPPAVRWERRKKPANAPSPSRAGATMTWHKGRGIFFGGVHDVEQGDEGMDSDFFNQLFAWNVERNRFMPLGLRRPRQQRKKAPEQRAGRRGRAQANEEELLRQLAALETGASLDDADGLELDSKPDEPPQDEPPAKEMTVRMEPPHARFNAQLAVQDNVLYIYGGAFEKGDREYTFDDLYAIDLSKLDGCREIFSRPVDDWVVSVGRAGTRRRDADGPMQESEDDESEDEDDEDEDEEREEEEENEAEQQHTPSRRKKADDGVSDATSETASAAPSDEFEAETTASSVDDGLPHPRVSRACPHPLPPPPKKIPLRVLPMSSAHTLPPNAAQPFETRRDFFARTSAAWQEVLITSLRWKGAQPERLSVKEIKAKAFELSEEKWWDSREEITALEEQEAAGIHEIVSLADRGDAAAEVSRGAAHVFDLFWNSHPAQRRRGGGSEEPRRREARRDHPREGTPKEQRVSPPSPFPPFPYPLPTPPSSCPPTANLQERRRRRRGFKAAAVAAAGAARRPWAGTPCLRRRRPGRTRSGRRWARRP